MTRNELYSEISTAKTKVENMTNSGKSASKEREQLKNLLLTNVHTILEALNGETVVCEIDPEEVQELKEELEAAEDALADTDQKIKVLKYLMRENGLDPNKLLAEYEENLAEAIEDKAREPEKGDAE